MVNSETDKVLEILNDFGLEKIKDIILKSEKKQREYGIRFCKNGKIETTGICKGKDCKVSLGYCPDNKKATGSFHTHPMTKKGRANFLSDDDIYGESTDDSDFACLGTVEDNHPKIKCYLPPFGVSKDIVSNRNNSRKEYNTKSREYNPSGDEGNISKLPYEKQKELRGLYLKHLITDKRLRVESARAALKLLKELDQGADIVINLK